ncbi:MAG: DUF3224 domain-containing protein [Pseudomonadota bacterium]|nr:DUF3224 domain-containing protein [Pseudomonadota bacterium]
MLVQKPIAGLLCVLALCLAAQANADSQQPTKPARHLEQSAMTQHAAGTFDVKLLPLPSDAHGPDSPIGRMSNDKRFHGDLNGSSKGQMLMIRSTVEGSAAYVSIEVVTATLQGRSGSFALQHNGTMTRGVGQMAVTVVPDSGTEALQGLVGSLTITVANGVHGYDLAYTLPELP